MDADVYNSGEVTLDGDTDPVEYDTRRLGGRGEEMECAEMEIAFSVRCSSREYLNLSSCLLDNLLISDSRKLHSDKAMAENLQFLPRPSRDLGPCWFLLTFGGDADHSVFVRASC